MNGKQNETAETKQNKFSLPARGEGGPDPFARKTKKAMKKHSLLRAYVRFLRQQGSHFEGDTVFRLVSHSERVDHSLVFCVMS